VAAPALLPWLSVVILSIAAVVLRHLLAANTDVSWLLTVGERVLDGQRLYIDVVETNPPMAVLVYIPGIAIARVLGLPVEVVTDSLMFAAIIVSLAIIASILRNSSVLDGAQSRPLAPLAFAVLAILPMQAFGQREHIAILVLLPLLAVFSVRMKGEAPSTWMAVVAGCGAGIAFCRGNTLRSGLCRHLLAIVESSVYAGKSDGCGNRFALRRKRYRILPGVLHHYRASGPRCLYSRRSLIPDASGKTCLANLGCDDPCDNCPETTRQD
jgi:hypothetical protein